MENDARASGGFGAADVVRALRRGLSCRCPHCGTGEIFERWATLRDRCPDCGLRLLRRQGDLWAFLVVVDRVVIIAPLIVAYYFGWLPEAVSALVALGAGAIALFIVTTPNRTGFCLAIDYATRRRWDDLVGESP